MNPQFYDLDFLKEQLEKIPHFHRVAFAGSICERMLPMYNQFSQIESWGQPSLLREVLNEIWLILESEVIDSSRLHQLIEYLDGKNVYPDDQIEDFYHFDYLFEAQFTVSALYSTLTALLTSDLMYIIGVLKNARFETIEGFISQINELYEIDNCKKAMELIASHPLAKQELTKEMEDLERLRNADQLEAELLELLRTSSYGKSLIDSVV